MSKVEKGELRVPAICNGSVIDHIPADQVMQVVSLLALDTCSYPLTIGMNFCSKKLGKKGLIKVENKHFTPQEVEMLALVSSDIVINVIQNYQVVSKIQAKLPEQVVGIVQCPNPKCISNNEPMRSKFHVTNSAAGTLRCCYCNRNITANNIIIRSAQE